MLILQYISMQLPCEVFFLMQMCVASWIQSRALNLHVCFPGWLPLRPSPRADSWLWAPSSVTVGGRRRRPGRRVPWLTDLHPSLSAQRAREPPGASMEVSGQLCFVPLQHPAWVQLVGCVWFCFDLVSLGFWSLWKLLSIPWMLLEFASLWKSNLFNFSLQCKTWM